MYILLWYIPSNLGLRCTSHLILPSSTSVEYLILHFGLKVVHRFDHHQVRRPGLNLYLYHNHLALMFWRDE